MSFIRSVYSGVGAGACSRSLSVRLFSTSSAHLVKAHKREKLQRPKGVQFQNKKQKTEGMRTPQRSQMLKKHVPWDRPKPGSGSKRRLLEPKEKKEEKGKPTYKSKHPADKKAVKLGFGEFSGLKEITEGDVKSASRLIEKIDNWRALKLLPEVRDAVVESIKKNSILNYTNFVGPSSQERKRKDDEISTSPSPIQVAAIKVISKYLLTPELTTYTIAAETGSGKTWAYMAPLIDSLKHQEQTEEWEIMKNKGIVRSVILVPTHELADQVYRSALDVYPKLGLNVFKWDTGASHRDFINALRNRIDILITTPGKINGIDKIRIIGNPDYVFLRTGFLAIDEADTLMDRSWIEDTCASIKRLPNLQNLVFCSATIPQEFNKSMAKLFPDSIAIATPSLHKLPKNIKFTLIDSAVSPYQGSKMKALAQALYAIHRDGSEPGFEKRVIVFVNEKADVGRIAEKLRQQYNHDVVSLTGSDSAEVRAEKVGAFISPPRRLVDIPEQEQKNAEKEDQPVSFTHSNIVLKPKKKSSIEEEGAMKVLVTTDLLARGLNFSAVRNVILYDVPNTSADLVHRAGRTGRMNQQGRVFLIIDKKSKHWVRRLPSTVRNNGLIT